MPLANTEQDRYERDFLAAIDRALAFAPAERPQSVEQWKQAFGSSLRRVEDAPTQRMTTRPDDAVIRLGGVSRPRDEPSTTPSPTRSSRGKVWIAVALIVIAAGAVWRFLVSGRHRDQQ